MSKMGLWEDTVAVKLESIENSYFTYIPARYLKKKKKKKLLEKVLHLSVKCTFHKF